MAVALTAASEALCPSGEWAYVDPSSLPGVLWPAAAVAAAMAFGIGANDAANSWATSVGSGAVPLRLAVILGGGADWLGAVALGSNVAGTIKGATTLSDPSACWRCGTCESKLAVFYTGMAAALAAAALFLLLATFTKMPVSTTHAVVGGVVGMTLAGVGPGCLNWAWHGGLGGIVGSWVISPAFSGAVAFVLDWGVRELVLSAKRPDERSLLALPFALGAEAFIVVLLILVKGQKTKGWRFGAQLGVAAGASAATTALGYLFTRFYVRRRVAEVTIPGSLRMCSSRSDHAACTTGSKRVSLDSEAANGDDEKSDDLVRLTTARPDSHVAGAADAADIEGARSAGEVWCASDDAEGDGALVLEAADGASSAATRAVRLARARRVFAFALVFVATLESFAHGANDTANATAPLSAVWGIYHGGRGTCGNAAVPLWILAAAGFFVFLGVVTFGRRVIDTVGRGMTRVDTAMGFSIECASSLTVLLASFLGWPVSTTHCQVGAVVAVGLAHTPESLPVAAAGDDNMADSDLNEAAPAAGDADASGRGVAGVLGRVRWGLVGKIGLSWLLTLPIAGGVAAAITAAVEPLLRS